MRHFLLQEIQGTPLLRAMSWTLIHSLWEGLLFALVAGIIIIATKRSSSSLRYNLLACLFFLFLFIASYTFIREWKPDIKTQGAYRTGYTVQTEQQQAPRFTNDDLSTLSNARHYIHVFVNYFNENASLVVMVWFIVFCARFVKLLANMGQIQRIKHYKTTAADPFWEQKLKELAQLLQIRKPIQLLQSGLVKVPMMAGFFKPVILFPISMFSQLSPEQVEAVLLHELAHIRRKDYLVNLLQHLVEIVFFFNPGVLWISSLIRDERENCCDDLAIGLTRDNRKFVHALLAFQEYNLETPVLASAFPGRKNHLLQRVKRILHHRNQTLNTMEKVFLAGCLFAIAALTLAFSQTQKHRPATPAAIAKKELPAISVIPDKAVTMATVNDPNIQAIDLSVPPIPVEKVELISPVQIDTTPSKITTITIEPDDMIIYVKNGYRIVTKKNKIVEAYYHDEKLSDDKLKELKPMLDKLIREQKMDSDAEWRDQAELMALKKSLMDSELAQEKLNLLSQTDMLKEQDALKEKMETDHLFERQEMLQKLKSEQFEVQKEYQADALKRQLLMLNHNQEKNLEMLKLQQEKIKIIADETKERNETYIDPILDDLQEAGIIKDREAVSFELTSERFVVNNKTQSRELFKKFKVKYIKGPKDYIKYKKSKGSTSTSINIDH